jgi:hypothetical protein
MSSADSADSSGTNLPPPPDELDLSRIGDLAATPLPTPKNIDISFFSHRTRKSTQLIGNKDKNITLRARREWWSFDLVDTIYITSIKVYASGYEDYHELELSIVDSSSGKRIEESRRFSGESFNFEPNRFISGFGLRPSERLWKIADITRIDVSGVEQKYFSEVVNIFDNISRERDRIESSLKK